MSKLVHVLTLLTLTLLPAASSAKTTCTDLVLVLAIDSSSSVDASEYTLQMKGYASAFRNPAVLLALAAAGPVKVAVIEWAGPQIPSLAIPWTTISTDADALRLAASFEAIERHVRGDTEIGNALMAALDLIEAQRCSFRQIVNLSGDGKASPGSSRGPARTSLSVAKARASTMGVLVNGLAISDDEPELANYYRTELITGAGCFVMEINSFSDFSAAILEKLLREIGLGFSASLLPETRQSLPPQNVLTAGKVR